MTLETAQGRAGGREEERCTAGQSAGGNMQARDCMLVLCSPTRSPPTAKQFGLRRLTFDCRCPAITGGSDTRCPEADTDAATDLAVPNPLQESTVR